MRFTDRPDAKARWLSAKQVRLNEDSGAGTGQWKGKLWLPIEVVATKPALSRKVINQRVGRVKRLFGWGVENDLVSVHVHSALLRVKDLRKGRHGIDRPRVRPVPLGTLEKILPHLPGVLRTALLVQYACGCRAGELLKMRPVDVDRSGRTWIYRPQGHEVLTAAGEAVGWQAGHKTEWRDHDRIIAIGPDAQRWLAPYLLKCGLEQFVFRSELAEPGKRDNTRHERRVRPGRVVRRKRALA